MAMPWTFILLCGLLVTTLVQAIFNPPAVLYVGPEAIKEKLTQELKSHNATTILQQLPLFRAMQEQSTRDIPLLNSLMNAFLKYILWLKVTSANIPQLQIQASMYEQELVIKIPLDMVAGFNTPLVKNIVEMHLEFEVYALLRVEARKNSPAHLVLSDCFSNQGSLRISLLNRLTFFVNSIVEKVNSLLVPTLPKLVKTQLCPVIQGAFDDMYADFLRLVREPIPLSPGGLLFDLLSSTMEDNIIQFNLQAKLLDSKGNVINCFNDSSATLTMPTLDDAPFSFIVRQDVLNAVVAAMVAPEELSVLLAYGFPDLARELKSVIKEINEKAADLLDHTQLVKIQPRNSPQLFLSQDNSQAAQMIVFKVIPTNTAEQPFFILGIEAKSAARFYTNGDRLGLSLTDISADRIKLMNSNVDVFNPILLKDIVTKILVSVLLPNQNGKLRAGIPLSLAKALGYKSVTLTPTKDALLITPTTS